MAGGLLSGKVVLVTGGASGIGEATARLCSEHGASVVIVDIQEERGEEVARTLPASLFIRVDVRDERQIEAAVGATVERFGQLDCMVNNAGAVGAVGSLEKTELEDWRRTFALLVDSVFLGMKHAARVMAPRRTGSIVSIASSAGLAGGVGPHAYTTAKHGVVGLTKSAASELARHGVRVNAVAPGNTVTPLVIAARGSREAALERSAISSPLHQPILPQDIAASVLFLASDLSRHITGQTIAVDGGVTSILETPAGALPFHDMKPALLAP